jgi:putative peptidoglycan lipid II flippase
MIVSLLNVLVNYFTAKTLLKTAGLGHEGLAVTTSVVATFGFLTLFWILRNRLGGIHGGALLSSFIRVLAAAGVMGITVYASHRAIWTWIGREKLGCLLDLAVSIPLGAVVFWAVSRALGIPELATAMQSLQGLFRRFGLAR